MRAYQRVPNEGFGVSRLWSGLFFEGSILFACQQSKMPNDGKTSALHRRKFTRSVILSTTFPISPFYPERRDDLSKPELMRLGQFFSAAALIGGGTDSGRRFLRPPSGIARVVFGVGAASCRKSEGGRSGITPTQSADNP